MQFNYSGLSGVQAEKALAEYGANELANKQRTSPWRLLLLQFKDVLIIILAAATAFSVVMGEYYEALSIIAIMLLNATLGFLQQYRTEKTLESLAQLSAPQACVIRDSRKQTIAAAAVVPGDIMLLKAGDRVAADCRLLDGCEVSADESLLTGESAAADKQKGAPLYMGTSVLTGSGAAKATATGMSTEMGRIADMLGSAKEEPTPLQRELAGLGRWIAIACVSVCAAVSAVGVLRGEPVMDMILTGLSLAVAAIPEGLPAIVTVVLALSVNRLLKKQVVIRRLHAVETLGCATVICCDKTGTITENRMAVREYWTQSRHGSFTPAAAAEHAVSAALRTVTICSDATPGEGKDEIDGSPTEAALLRAALSCKLSPAALYSGRTRVKEQPFDSRTRMMSVTLAGPGGRTEYIKGAPDVILKKCRYILAGGAKVALTPLLRSAVLSAVADMGSRALRVLAAASSSGGDYIFEALFGLQDPLRPEVADAVSRCRSAGIRPVMLTGDHPRTAQAIAREAGILRGQCVSGDEIDGMDDNELAAQLAHTSVFARVRPEHKLRLVRALKKSGEVVAMGGDGVNDAPAVREADVGVAMGKRGTDVTKQAAAVVILNDDFSAIVAAVEQGRIIYRNIRNFIVYLLTCNFGEVASVVLGMIVGTPVLFEPIQLLLINLITDGLPAIAIGMQSGSENVMFEPPRQVGSGILTRRMAAGIFSRGFVMGACNLLSFCGSYYLCGELAQARSAAYITLVSVQMLFVIESRLSGSRKLMITANPALLGAIVLSLVTTAATVYLPALQAVFDTAAVTLPSLMCVAACALLAVLLGALMRRLSR